MYKLFFSLHSIQFELKNLQYHQITKLSELECNFWHAFVCSVFRLLNIAHGKSAGNWVSFFCINLYKLLS